MREIKFRAFNKQCDCESCGGTFTSWERLLKIQYTTNPDQANNFFEDDGYVLEQFTGLLDKNGKEIYEGDIFNLSQGGVVVSRRNKVDLADFLGGHYWVTNHGKTPVYEVTGNIHENPELVEGLS